MSNLIVLIHIVKILDLDEDISSFYDILDNDNFLARWKKK
jgi:hypothetical protein